MTIRLIIYDLDGTLIDAFGDIAAALNYGLAEFGFPVHTLERVKSFVGDGIVKLVERALPEADRGRAAEIVRVVANRYQNNSAKTTIVYPGVFETLAAVRALGLKQAILTNKPEAIAITTCEKLDLARRVDAIRGETPDRPIKPDPAGALELVSRWGLTPAQCIMVGDGRADVEVARRAGMRSVGCAWGATEPERLRGFGPDLTIESMSDLLGSLGLTE